MRVHFRISVIAVLLLPSILTTGEAGSCLVRVSPTLLDVPLNTTPGDLRADTLFTSIGRWSAGTSYGLANAGSYAIVCNGALFQVVDISNPQRPSLIGEVEIPLRAVGPIVRDTLVYVHNGGDLFVIDIQDPTTPSILGSVHLSNDAPITGLALDSDSLIFVTLSGNWLLCVDVSDPRNPRFRSDTNTGVVSPEIAAKDHRVYIGSRARPYPTIADARNPDNLILRPISNIDGWLSLPLVHDTLLLAAFFNNVDSGGLSVYSINNPDSLIPLGQGPHELPGFTISDFSSVDSLVYVSTSDSGLYVVNISDVRNPRVHWRLPNWLPAYNYLGVTSASANSVLVGEARGVGIYSRASGDSLRLSSFWPIGVEAVRIDVAGTLAYVAAGVGGLWTVDVSDPVHPHSLANLGTDGYVRDVVVAGPFAYILCGDLDSPLTPVPDSLQGLLVVNISNPAAMQPAAWFPLHRPLTVIKEGSHLFISLDEPSARDTVLAIFDVSDPLRPMPTAYLRGGYRVTRLAANDSLLFLASPDSGLKIISYQGSPSLHVQSSLFDRAYGVVLADSIAYINGGTFDWPTVRESLYVLNVRLPEQPLIKGRTEWPRHAGGARDVMLQGNTLVWGSSRDCGIFDVHNMAMPLSLGWTDSYNVRGITRFAEFVVMNHNEFGFTIVRNDRISSVAESHAWVDEPEIELFELYPNPFNASTKLRVDLKRSVEVKVDLFDLRGCLVKRVWSGMMEQGPQTIPLPAGELSSGVYFVRVICQNRVSTKKAIILR